MTDQQNHEKISEAKKIMEELLAMTRSLILTGAEDREEEEINAYAELMEKREPLVQKLAELKLEVDAAMASSPEFEEVQQAVRELADIDSTNLSYVESMKDVMKEALRKIKNGQKIHAGYTSIPAAAEATASFDVKQ